VGTRNHSELVLNALAAALPELMGGSADLTPSNLTNLKVSMNTHIAPGDGCDYIMI
jgi:transketolase